MARRIWITAGAALWLAACSQQPSSGDTSGAASAPSAPSAGSAPARASAVESPAQPAPPASQAAADLPRRIVAKRGGFLPEGIEYDQKNHRFLTGSLAEGTIFHVGADGTLEPFVMDPALVSSVGIEVDEARNRLLVCNSDRAVFDGKSSGQAKLGIYDLGSGARIAMVDLTSTMRRKPPDAQFFANDVAVGDDGTVYVTDSRQNTVYRVGADNQPAVLYKFEPKEGFALNGIVYSAGGYLIVAGGPRLYRITVGDPAKMNEVGLPEPIEGADGMVFLPDGRLAVVSNSQSRVVVLASDDDWYSATVAETAKLDGQATTAAVAGGGLYVIHPHFDDQDPPVIERVDL